MTKGDIIVVTGATGFIAKHVMAQLLDAGFRVRATLRNPDKSQQVHKTIDGMCASPINERLELVQCDLLADEGWKQAMDGARALMHLAAYVPAREPKKEESVIRPSLEGSERVLNFALDAGINRVVMTSSIAAIGYGHKYAGSSVDFTADDWTDVVGLKDSWAYPKAKVLAEKLAWKIADEKGLDLTCICPSMVFGPIPDNDTSASLEVIKQLMTGQIPAIPPGGLSVIDVRDVAKIHVSALNDDKTFGQRIIASAQYIKFTQIAEILGTKYPSAKIPRFIAPILLLKIVGVFSRTIRQIVADLDVVRNYDGSAGEQLLGCKYFDASDASLASARSLIELGLVKLPD